MSSARIMAYMGLDTSNFQTGLEKANKLAGTAGQQLERKLGLKHAFKGLFAGVGIGIDQLSENIARFFSGMSKSAEESLGKIVTASETASRTLEQRLEKGRDPSSNLTITDRKLQERTSELNSELAKPQMTENMERMTGLGLGLGDVFKKLYKGRGFRDDEHAADLTAEIAGLQQKQSDYRGASTDQQRESRNLDAETKLAGNDSTDAKLNEILRQRDDLLKEADGLEKTSERHSQLILAAKKLELQYAKETHQETTVERDTTEKIAETKRATAQLSLTTGEKIVALKLEAEAYDKRAFDMSRPLAEREEARASAARMRAEAEKEAYQWTNKPLTVADAAKKSANGLNNTSTGGVLARRVQHYQEVADRARRIGNYSMAEHYDSLARSTKEDFDKRDRDGRTAAKAGPQKSGWDARYGGAMDDRQKRITAQYGSPIGGVGGGKANAGGSEMKQAAKDLSAAATELKTVHVSVDVN